ncbi:MAG TPA: lysophospholipid acyltransferase family protein [Actinomycetota bacterium]|nr:lysophospholipid acyltransferase family protein [Actinomycetota bacterium]
MGKRVYTGVIGAALGLIKSMNWPVTVLGAENVPADGPAILASNHIGYLDFVFSGYAARERNRRVRFLAKKEIFDKKGVGWLMRQMGHIPVDRFGVPDASVRAAVEALRAGEVIGMFPEATISPSFVPRKGKTGTVRAARETGAPIIPVAIWGTHRIMTKWRPRNFKRGIPIVVNVGAPMHALEGEDVDAQTARLMAQITELLAEAQELYPAKPGSDDDRWWLPAHLGGTAPTPEEAERRLDEERDQKRERRRSTPG